MISGFNTFLPPGYRIECSTDALSRDIIRVTTPSGTTSTTSGEPLNLQAENMEPSPYYNRTTNPPSYPPPPPPPASAAAGNNYRNNGSLPPISSYHPQQPRSSTTPQPPATQERRPSGSSPPASESGTRRAPVEFNHAINYVNKIKNRFSNDPETYKHFLEILQTYQKEQQPIQEVYAQVQILFNGANDLLAEFKQFLPDTSANVATTNEKKMKKRSLSGLPKQHKKSKIHHHKMMEMSDMRRSPVMTPLQEIRPMITEEEAAFFEKVKKYMGNKSSYHSFLRVIHLFSQQILDANGLIEKCEPLLGGQKELLDQLKKLVGYDGKDRIIENVPALVPKPDFAACQEYGPSYRSVPKSWQTQNCSGRDALCWEVLNDAYVSHPKWASEDSGFIASKKNLFEEALHRVEEERYGYDMNIEANLNTISLLEPIAKKLTAMTEEEKTLFRLPPGLGGPSKAIYQRIIKKIYGKEQGTDVIDKLHSNPAQTVPVLMKRMKQMDEEWKRSQVQKSVVKKRKKDKLNHLFLARVE